MNDGRFYPTLGWVQNLSSLKGKIFIVTGANSGLGFHTSKALLKRGATVIFACRDYRKACEAKNKIRESTNEGELIIQLLDLEDYRSIRTFCTIIKQQYPIFDCLINNAGISLKKPRYCEREPNLEIHFATNHIGPFLLTNLLLDNIKANKSRVVIVSSKLHEKGIIDFENLGRIVENDKNYRYYHNSKLMNFYFAKELYKRGVDVHVCCPGFCYTNIFQDHKPKFYHFVLFSPVALFVLRSAKQGAQNILHCAIDNFNTEEENPDNSYIIENLKQTKSNVDLIDDISENLWIESGKLCNLENELETIRRLRTFE